MKRLVFALAMMVPVQAHATALMCLFEKTSERFNVVRMNNDNYIQWAGGAWTAVVVNYEKPYLTVVQYADVATFKMVLDINIGKGYGGLEKFSGEKMESPITCAFD